MVRFVIGHTREAQQEEALALEEGNYGGFLRLPIQVWADCSLQRCNSGNLLSVGQTKCGSADRKATRA